MSESRHGESVRLYYGWVIVAATFSILFAAFGIVYSFGAFFLPLATEFGTSRAATASIFAYAVAVLFTAGAISGPLADRIGPRPMIRSGILAMTAGLIGASQATLFWQVALCFTAGVGLGVGLLYVPMVSTVQRWFVQRRGFASGLAVSGIGVGTLTVPVIAGLLLDLLDWRTLFLLMAFFIFAVGLIAAQFIEGNPADRGLQPDGLSTEQLSGAAISTSGSLREMVVSRAFVQYYVAQAILSVPILIPFAHLVPYAIDHGMTRAEGATVLGFIGLGSTLGRFLIGGFADRLGRKRTLTIMLAGTALSYVIWFGATEPLTLGLFALVFGLCYGGYVALTPALIADYFAGPRLSSVIGLQYTAAAIGSIAGPTLAGYLFDTTGSYTTSLICAGVCAVVAYLMVVFLPPVPVPARAQE